jgi:KipI family sensor histidine kinase inhibitor
MYQTAASGADVIEQLPWSAEPLGDSALTLRFGSRVDDAINARVLALWRHLHALALPGVVDLVPAFTTLTVIYDPVLWDPAILEARLVELARAAEVEPAGPGRCVEIPVCYEPEFAPDLDTVCAHTGLDAAEIVRLHSAASYRVHFLGFSPGFPYLGGLDARLATPRHATPRTGVEPGSVGIGGAQTGIYPQRTPGGWQIIGRTPLVLFDARRADPCLLAPGDSLRFVPIGGAEYRRLRDAG